MNLSHPDTRRGLRSAVMAIVVLCLLLFLWLWVARLGPAGLREAVRGALILIGIAQIGYQFENGMRAFKGSIGKGGVSFEAQGDAEAAAAGATAAVAGAQEVADALEDAKP